MGPTMLNTAMRPEYVALIACAFIAAAGVALLRLPSADPSHRWVGGLLVSIAGVCAVVVLLAVVYVLAFPH
jgi:hypothetical protein